MRGLAARACGEKKALVNLFYSFSVHHHAFQLRFQNVAVLLLLPLWTPLFLASVSARAKVVAAIVAFGMEQLTYSATHNAVFRRVFGLRFSTAIDIDHEVDRMAAFFTIVLGEFLYGLVWASPAGLSGVDAPFGRAALSLLVAFCLCWLYTASDGSRENTEAGVHALRWRATHALQWVVLHLPLSAALLIAGDICAVFVKYGHTGVGVAASPDTPAKEGEAKFPTDQEWKALRWQFCGGTAIGVFCLSWIALLHHEIDEDECTRRLLFVHYPWRRCVRLPVAVAIALLPLAPPDRLSITGLLGAVTALLALAVVWETVGGLNRRWTVLEARLDRSCGDDEEVAVAAVVEEAAVAVVVVEEEEKGAAETGEKELAEVHQGTHVDVKV